MLSGKISKLMTSSLGGNGVLIIADIPSGRGVKNVIALTMKLVPSLKGLV